MGILNRWEDQNSYSKTLSSFSKSITMSTKYEKEDFPKVET